MEAILPRPVFLPAGLAGRGGAGAGVLAAKDGSEGTPENSPAF